MVGILSQMSGLLAPTRTCFSPFPPFSLFSFHFEFDLISDLSKCTKATVHSSKIDRWHLLYKSYVSYLFSPLNGLLEVLYRSV